MTSLLKKFLDGYMAVTTVSGPFLERKCNLLLNLEEDLSLKFVRFGFTLGVPVDDDEGCIFFSFGGCRRRRL